MPAPVGGVCIGVQPGSHCGISQEGEQPIDLRKVLMLSLLEGCLRQTFKVNPVLQRTLLPRRTLVLNQENDGDILLPHLPVGKGKNG